ncbi:MAG: glycosyltransferase family 39 protein [Anaerolineae bacterium]|nr:glycosyltransferase family 39 protein [Anaerolineae bacterium]
MTSAVNAPPRWLLSGILAVFLLVGLLYVWQVPPYEGPDEGEHFAYIAWLVAEGSFPPQGAAAWETPVRQEAGQPPLYYLLASLPARFIDLDDPPAPYRINPHAFPGLHVTTHPDNDNRALHPPGENPPPLNGGWLALYLARLVSLAFGLLLLVGVYGLGRTLAPGEPSVALGATAMTAVIPQVLFLSSVASNDMAATALSALTLWLLARLLRACPQPRLAAATGLVFGLALLAKVNTAVLAFPLLLGWLWLVWKQRAAPAAALRAGLIMAATTALIAGWWFISVWQRYGSPFGMEAHDFTSWAIADRSQLAPFHVRWQEVFRSFWIMFGWGTIRPPGWVYTILLLFMLLALAGLIILFRRWWRRGRPFTAGAVTWALLLLSLLVAAIFLELWMQRVRAPFGRLLYPTLAPVVLGLVTGWRALHHRLPLLPLAFTAVLALLAPPLLLRPAYEPPPNLPAPAIAALPDQPVATFVADGDQAVAELLAAETLTRSAAAGDHAIVQLCWRALVQTQRDYTVLVHLLGPENAVVSGRRTYPGLGTLPTTLWPAGGAFCDEVSVWVPDDLARTLVYDVEIAMIDERSDRRLQPVSAGGDPLGIVRAGRVLLLGADATQVTLEPDGPAFRLLDAQLPETSWQPGADHHFALAWGVAEPVARDYQLFVHLRDPSSNQTVDQADGPPLDGWYPTSYWPQGYRVVDARTFPLSAGVPSGDYRLVVGFYDPLGGSRLGPDYDLGMVRVQP